MYAFFVHGRQASKAHSTEHACVIEAFEKGYAVKLPSHAPYRNRIVLNAQIAEIKTTTEGKNG